MARSLVKPYRPAKAVPLSPTSCCWLLTDAEVLDYGIPLGPEEAVPVRNVRGRGQWLQGI